MLCTIKTLIINIVKICEHDVHDYIYTRPFIFLTGINMNMWGKVESEKYRVHGVDAKNPLNPYHYPGPWTALKKK